MISQNIFTHDPSTLSKVQEYKLEHLSLNLQADFDKKCLNGTADLRINFFGKGTNNLICDTLSLNIHSVSILEEQINPLNYTHSDKTPHLGTPLVVHLDKTYEIGQFINIRIHYSTQPEGQAIQWLSKSSTAGKDYPYLFTQCEAIHARELVPLPDSPCHKFTFDAKIKVSKPLVALMACEIHHNPVSDESSTTYSFEQPIPIPSYLLAIAIGVLESRIIGPRSRVWSEKEMVESGAHEFSDTEAFLSTAEDILGIPYPWGRYDILLLPPSFPFGGMENPCLTFVTPTLLAGDRSLADVVAHEISHSWFGNLVTNNNWEDFWLNEGFTVFFERKILSRIHGNEMGDLAYEIGWDSLRRSVISYGENHSYTAMVPRLESNDPDDAFSSVPYEKGANFLLYLENLVGGSELMELFLRSYVDNFKFKSLSTNEFKSYFIKYFSNNPVVNTIDWNKWFYATGMPQKASKTSSSLLNQSQALANQWVTGVIQPTNITSWKHKQIAVFLDQLALLQDKDIENSKNVGESYKYKWSNIVDKLNNEYNFSESKNSELALRAHNKKYIDQAVKFVSNQGRMKFVRPLYKFLQDCSPSIAINSFQSSKSFYHNICAKMIAKDLGVDY